MGKLFGLWPQKLALQYRRYQIKRMIVQTERDLELTAREIADKQESRRSLQRDLMELKAERRSLGV